MEAKDLSKVKYIYRIYESSDEVLHCEKYPVIYINSKVVYFKTARKQDLLQYQYVKNVLDNFINFDLNESNWYRTYFYGYFWNIETNVEEIYEDLKKQRNILRQNDAAKRKQLRLEKAKREYEAALKDIEVFEKLGKVLGKDKE